MALDNQRIIIGVAIVLAAYLIYRYYYEDKTTTSSTTTHHTAASHGTSAQGITAGGTMGITKPQSCDGALNNLLAAHEQNARLEANMTEADYGNNVTSNAVRAGTVGNSNLTHQLDRGYDKLYGVSEDLEHHRKYQNYYGCEERTYAPATCFDGGNVTFSELKQLVSQS